MDKKMLSGVLITLVVAGSLGFYGGIKYAQSKGVVSGQNFQLGQGQQAFGQARNGQGTTAVRRNNMMGGGFLSGDVLSKDDKSITLKLRDGSSKIVFYSASTSVGKAVEGNSSDLAVGQQVTVAGTVNSDGSVTAQQIQIRPEQAPLPGGPQNNQ